MVPPGVKFLPNAITVLALCAGLSSVAFAHRGQWMVAAAMIAAAAVLDSLDGPAARLLRSESRMGAELDSFSDCVSFGVAPALVMYLWKLDTGSVGWAVCLIYAVCTTLRLARFNSALNDDAPKPWAKGFFTGVPSPAGALLAIQPMLLWTRFGDGWWSNPWVSSVWLLLVGGLMISRLPSIALKHVFIPPRLILPALVGLVIGVMVLFYEPVIVLAIGLVLYLAHLPYAAWRYQHIRRRPELWYDNRRMQTRARAARRLRPQLGSRRIAGYTGSGRRIGDRRSTGTSRAGGDPTSSGRRPAADAARRLPRRLGRRLP